MLEKELQSQDKLPTKEERKAMQAQQKRDEEDCRILKALCLEFFNEKLVKLDIPVFLVETHVPQALSNIIKIHKAKSKKFQKFLEAREAAENESIKDIKYDEIIK